MEPTEIPLKFNSEIDYLKSDKPFVVCRFITECSKYLILLAYNIADYFFDRTSVRIL